MGNQNAFRAAVQKISFHLNNIKARNGVLSYIIETEINKKDEFAYLCAVI